MKNDKVMKEKKLFRSRIIGLRLTLQEYDQIDQKCKSSTCKKLSEYIRHIIFNKPVTMLQRDQSLDDFMAEMMLLRNELNHAGNNFNQAVKKLNSLHLIPDFKSWLIAYETDKNNLFNSIDEIKKCINKIADEWLQ